MLIFSTKIERNLRIFVITYHTETSSTQGSESIFSASGFRVKHGMTGRSALGDTHSKQGIHLNVFWIPALLPFDCAQGDIKRAFLVRALFQFHLFNPRAHCFW